MGRLIHGKWDNNPLPPTNKTGHFIRPESVFQNKISIKNKHYPPEANRYHLYISYACPWASRALIMLKLKGLEKVISFSSVSTLLLEEGWEFSQDKKNLYSDPILGKHFLRELYLLADKYYTGKVTVPVLWDKKTNTIVNNESSDIMRIFNQEFDQYCQNKTDYYPAQYRKLIDEINDFVYENINNGVYKCGFATSQSAYDEACDHLFAALAKVEKILAKKRYLIGSIITEADWRLFVTLVRFDSVYVTHFKCNKKLLRDFPNISNYLRELYQIDGISDTVKQEDIKEHYYCSHQSLNPYGIIPQGFEFDFKAKHDREKINLN